MQSVQSAISAASESLSPEQPLRVIRPGRSASLFNFREVWLYRDLILALAIRDIKLRYRQTLLGAIWVVFQPLMSAGIFSFIFTGLGNFKTDGVNPFIFAFSGMLIYNVFSSVVGKTSNIMVANNNLVSKVYFPRICLPLSVLPSVLVDLSVSFVVMLGLMFFYGQALSIGILLWPLMVVLTMIFGLGFGLIAASLSVTYRDIQYIVPVIMSLTMYINPVAYSTSNVTDSAKVSSFAKQLYFLNPFVEILGTSRYLLMGEGTINPAGLAVSVGFTAVLAYLGLSCFRALERKFADVI